MKNLLLLRTSAGISRYGPRLMIVMIFVTQITFQTVQEFPTISLDFTSQSLNDKIRNKRWFFPTIFLSLFRVGVTDCKQRTKPTKCCLVSGRVKQATAIKNHGKCAEKIALWERWVVSKIVLPKSALRKRSRCYWETWSDVKGQHALTRTDNRRRNYMKKTPFVADFGCNR